MNKPSNGFAAANGTKEKVIIFDTTLRDGEQSPGNSMTVKEKLMFAQQLEKLGVDVMEAGFAASSDDDWWAIRIIGRAVQGMTVAALARATVNDIEKAASALKHAQRPRIHTFIATSDIHRSKLGKSNDELINIIEKSVRHARKFTDDVEWSAEDATRTDIDFLCRCVETAIKAGATTINLPDTVGYSVADEYAHMFREVMYRIPNADKVVFSAHCHDDLGMATANSLSAVMAGVRQVECTINAIGERAGNAGLEEIAAAIATRGDVLPFYTDINLDQIGPTSRLLADITGIQPAGNKAIVGANAFAHASGIHQDGMLKNRETYEIMNPENFGVKSSLVLAKHSGKAAVRQALVDIGLDATSEQIDIITQDVKDFCGEHKKIGEDELRKIAEGVLNPYAQRKHSAASVSLSGFGTLNPG